MRTELLDVIACPRCRLRLGFSGDTSDGRFVNGLLRCRRGHAYQVRDEIPILKEQKLSKGEFEWKVGFPDIKKYDETRKRYASFLSEELIDADREMVDEIARAASEEEVVLDVASGMGTLLIALSHSVHARCHILGMDVDEKPLRGARIKLEEQKGYGRASLCVMDGKHLGIRSRRLPCVISHFGFNNIPRAGSAFREVARVLGAHGKLLFSAIWLEEGSKSLALAEKLGYGGTMTETGINKTLEEAGFKTDSTKVFYSGQWKHNPMDLLPIEGDRFAHVLVRASKR